MKINVYSEIGKLKKVLVHRPGKEVERIYPELFERLLFDDIMFLKKAQEEHDYFTDKLRENGVEVIYIENLVAKSLDESFDLRKAFIHDYLKLANISNDTVYDTAFEFFNNITNNLELVKATIAGIKKSELKPKFKNTLADQVLLEDEYPFYIDPIPNLLFQRDPIASIFDGMNIHNMHTKTRQREQLYYLYGFNKNSEYNDLKLLMEPNHDGSMEGGDILVISEKVIFIGISERTNSKAIETFSKKMFEQYSHLKSIVGVVIPKAHATMHLDTVLTMMDHNIFSIDADLMNERYTFLILKKENDQIVFSKRMDNIKNVLKDYVHPNIKLVTVGGNDKIRSKREQWNDGANCLCLEPKKIIVYDRNYYTNEEIKKMGVQIIEIPSSELSRGRGGPRCMSMPLVRENIGGNE